MGAMTVENLWSEIGSVFSRKETDQKSDKRKKIAKMAGYYIRSFQLPSSRFDFFMKWISLDVRNEKIIEKVIVQNNNYLMLDNPKL